MLGGYKNILFLSISMCYAVPCFAQFIDDIPLFGEAPVSATAEKEAPASLVMTPKPKEERPQENKPEPNIGKKGIPLDKVVLTPDPLPEVSINLKDKPQIPLTTVEQQRPINTRQEGIVISSTNKPSPQKEQSSQFTTFHDVRQFDIEGFYLGMPPKEVIRMANQKGYKIDKTKKASPLFQTTYYDTLCREAGLHNPTAIRSCIREYAKSKNQAYVEQILLTKKATHESFQFIFTSPATGNEAYQIIYHNKGDNSLNFTHPNLVKKLSRKEAFFNAIFEMYGYPDDKDLLVWGSPKDAYMQVSMVGSSYDATITLVDMKLSDEDYFEATDWKADNTPNYHFGFAE